MALALPLRQPPPWHRRLAQFVLRKPLGALGAAVGILFVALAVVAPLASPYDPVKMTPALQFAPPGGDYLLGGDDMGRDVLSRLIWGARISLYVGVLASVIGTTSGAGLGVAGAFFSGRTDIIVQRIMDALMAFPAMLLAIAIMAAVGQGLNNVVVALSVSFVAITSRTMRAAALSIKENQYVEAARSIGCSPWRIVLRHVAPNCAASYLILVTYNFGYAIIVESSLSYLGIGVPPPISSWGGMLTDAQKWINVAPWLAIYPGLMITVVVFAINVFGDALRDVLDPRLRGR